MFTTSGKPEIPAFFNNEIHFLQKTKLSVTGFLQKECCRYEWNQFCIEIAFLLGHRYGPPANVNGSSPTVAATNGSGPMLRGSYRSFIGRGRT